VIPGQTFFSQQLGELAKKASGCELFGSKLGLLSNNPRLAENFVFPRRAWALARRSECLDAVRPKPNVARLHEIFDLVLEARATSFPACRRSRSKTAAIGERDPPESASQYSVQADTLQRLSLSWRTCGVISGHRKDNVSFVAQEKPSVRNSNLDGR
jgi:hypothetical protein